MECAELLRALGARIKTLRKAKGISQERLAELANLSVVFMSNVENGHRRASICTYNDVAKALGMSLAELVEFPGDRESWSENLVLLFQEAKSLSDNQQRVFTEVVKGALAGIKGG